MVNSSYEKRMRAELIAQMTHREADDSRGPATPAEIARAKQIADERVAEWKRRRRG